MFSFFNHFSTKFVFLSAYSYYDCRIILNSSFVDLFVVASRKNEIHLKKNLLYFLRLVKLAINWSISFRNQTDTSLVQDNVTRTWYAGWRHGEFNVLQTGSKSERVRAESQISGQKKLPTFIMIH